MQFDNATLNNVWTRIVTATTALCGSIGGTGFKHVHDALIAYTGLKRSTTASTPGDYLKGIARCARHIGGGTASSNTLAEIADLLEGAGWEPSVQWEIRDATWEENFYIQDGYLHVGGDPWRIIRSDNLETVGYVYPNEPFSLLELRSPVDHYVVSGLPETGDSVKCTLVFVGT